MSYYLDRLFHHPVVLAALILAVAAPCWVFALRIAVRTNFRRLGPFAAGAVILAYLGAICWYGYGPHFADHVEPLVVCVAWAYLHGQPIYHAADAAARYALQYGPLCYLLEAAWLRLTGPSLDWAKMPGVLASALSVALVGVLIARLRGWRRALPITALFCLVLFQFWPAVAFWTRPDPFFLLAMSAATLAAETFRPRRGVLLVGVALGAVPLLKIFGFIYFLPLVPLIWRRWGTRAVFVAGFIGLIVFALPFTVLPRISLANHLYWLSVARSEGFDWVMFRFNVEYALFYLAPLVVLGVFAKLEVARLEWMGLAAALAGALLFGSMKGAGWYYLMPLVPVMVMMGTRPVHAPLPAWTGPAWASFVLAALCMGLYGGVGLAGIIAEQGDAPKEEQELLGVIRDHPHDWLAMGSEGGGSRFDEPSTLRINLRPLLLFAGSPLGIDPTYLVGQIREEISEPAGTLATFDRGEYAYWLFPDGEQPFKAFPYSAQMRDHFLGHYAILKRGRYYDVWSFRGQEPAAVRP